MCRDALQYGVFGSAENYLWLERIMESNFETMLIFLDYDDMIDIVSNRVIPMLKRRPFKNDTRWFEFLNNKIKYWNDCINYPNEDY